MNDNIPTKVLNAIQQAGTEVAEMGVKGTETVLKTVITGQELVPDAKTMTEEEMAKAKAEDERKRREGIENELKNIPGRDVSGEMRQIAQEEKNEEQRKQQEFLENVERQRRAEEEERNKLMMNEPGNQKREAAKRSMSPGKKKSAQTAAPNASQMSATSEFKGGKID